MKKQNLLNLPIETISQTLAQAIRRDMDITEFFVALYFTVKLDVALKQLESILTEMDKAELSDSVIEVTKQTLLSSLRDEKVKRVTEQLLDRKGKII